MNANIWGRWVSRLFQQRRQARRPYSATRRLLFESLEDRITPTTFIWSGLGGNNNWSTAGNWQGGVAPSGPANPDIVFNSVTPRLNTNNDLANLPVNSITISASNYALNGNKILLGGNVTVGSGATNERITLDVQLTTVSSFTVNNVADLTVSGQLTGSSTLTKKGVGTMMLSSDNSAYTGLIDVQTGRLVMSNVNALGSAAAGTTVEANAQLQVRNIAAAINEPIILNGPGTNNDGALLNSLGNNTWVGTITLDSDASFGAESGTSLNVTGLITDTGFTGGRNLTKAGPGTVILSRVGGNNYRGQTIVNNGILQIRDPLSLGAGATAGTPQSGTPQSGAIVNFNATTGEAGTLQLNFTNLAANDPNGVLQDPSQPFHPVNNPYIGFQVFNDLLTLNGPGFSGIGALNNFNGHNIWNGDTTIGSPLPNTSDITIGVAEDTELIVSGVVSDDPNRTGTAIPDLFKILPGRLVFDNANTYRGNTIVETGVLTIRDSLGLGAAGLFGGSTSVISDPYIQRTAAVEYEVDQGLDGTLLRTHNRNLGFDSVRLSGLWQEIVVPSTSGTFTVTFNGASTGALPFNASASQVQTALQALPTIGAGNVAVTQNGMVYRVTFTGTLLSINVPLMTVSGTAGAVINNAYGLTVPEDLFLDGLGIEDTGALRSVSGLNRHTGIISFGNFLVNPFTGAAITAPDPRGSIGVEPDSRPGHPTADNTYFTSDFSLTVSTPDALQSLSKPYSVVETFVKVGDGQLILPVANTQLNGAIDIREGWITIQDSQSLGRPIVHPELGDTAQPNTVAVRDGASLQLLPLSGNLTIANELALYGRGITHPFAMLEQGALLSLRGNNTVSGNIGLGTPSKTDSDQVGIGVDDPITSNPPSASTLRVTGAISDYVPPVMNLRDHEIDLDIAWNDEQTFVFDTNSSSGLIRIDWQFFPYPLPPLPFDEPDRLLVYYGPRTQGNETLIFDSGLISGTGPSFVVPYGPGDFTYIEIVMNQGGQPIFSTWELPRILIYPDHPPAGNGLIKMGARDLSLQGEGTFTGDVEVRSGALRVQSDSALGRDGSSTALDASVQSYTTTRTTVNAGATLQIDATNPQNAGGFAAGVQAWDERLVLNGAAQQVAVNGSAGTFTLTFNGQTTSPLAFDVSAAQMQIALNALSSIGGAGGTATVTLAGNIYTVVFGGSLAGLDNPLLVGAAGPAPGNVTVQVSGTNAPLSVLGQDNLWRGPITLASDTVIDVADNSRLSLLGPITDATNPSPTGSSLSVGLPGSGNTGELVLGGVNSYRGTTYVNQGILTITDGQALGGIGGPEVQTVTLGGAAGGTFSLTFEGQTTADLARSASAAQIQAALNALSTIGGAGGSVSVSRTTNVVTVTFGGGVLAGADQPLLTATGGSGTTATVATTTDGFGGTVVTAGAQIQVQGSLTVAGESLTLSGTGVGVSDVPDSIPLRWFTIGSSPINNAQTPGENASTGRVTGVAVDPSDSSVIYLSTAGGGAWKTRNGGDTWIPLFDNNSAMFSGAIAIAPSDASVIYLGTGETNNSGDSFYGTGVYKSTDSGRTWTLVTGPGGTNPLLGTAISRIVVDPNNPNRIYAATTDSPVNTNAAFGTAGVWRHDGTSWVNLTAIVSTTRNGILPTPNAGFPATAPGTPGADDDWRTSFRSFFASYSDLQLGTSVDAFGTVVPALFMALGTPFSSSETSNAVYRLLSPAQAGTPATTHWFVGDGNPVVPPPPAPNGIHTYSTGGTNPFPHGDFTTGISRNSTTKIAVNGMTIYAAITDDGDPANGFITAGMLLRVVKSTDGGRNWANTASQPANYMGQQGEYDTAVAVDPYNANTVYLVGLSGVLRSTDGGATWSSIAVDATGNGPHVDFHTAQVDSESRLIAASDGGAWRWDPLTALWTNLNGGGLAITTFNGITSHPTNPNIVMGGSQDNGTEKFTGSQAWEHVDPGDGGEVYFDPNNPLNAYHVLNGRLRKSIDGGNTWFDTGFSKPGLYFSFVVDPIDSSRLVIAGIFVEESLDGGQTFTNLFDNLFGAIDEVAIAGYQGTYQFDPDFPLVADMGANTYDPNTIYATDGFGISVTKDHAASWVSRTPVGFGNGIVASLVVDPRNRDTVFAVLQGEPGSGDNRVLKSTDAGQNWTDITNNLADIPGTDTDIPLWKIIIDPRTGTLYLGTDQGIWSLRDGTGTWERFGIGMPKVQVKEIDLNLGLNMITAGSYGRSAFQFYLDDVEADSGALRATSGLSAWTGPVRLAADTTIGVGGSQAFLSGAAAATLDIIGVISDTSSGNFKLTKDGGGTLVFSGTNTYGGLTEVANGVLTVNNHDALGTFRPGANITAQGGTVVDSGAALQLQTDLEGEPVVLNGNGVSPGLNGHFAGALRNISGNNTYTGNLTLNTDSTIGVDSGSQLTFGTLPPLIGNGTITGASHLTKELTGILVLAGDNPNFSGGTTVNQGALRLEHSGALGAGVAGAVVMDGAQMQLRTPTSGPNANQPVVVSKQLVLSGTGIFGTGALLNAGGNNAWNGSISFDTISGFSPNTFPAGAVSINVADAADTLTLGGAISQTTPTGLTKIGPGRLVLMTGNGYSGATEVAQGILNVRDPNALGTRLGTVSTASIQRVVTLSAAQVGDFTLSFNGQSTVPALNWSATEAEVRAALEGLSSIGPGQIASVVRTEIATSTQNGPGEPQTGFQYTITFAGTLTNTIIPLTASGANGTGASASVVATGGIDVRVANNAALELETAGPGISVAGHKLTMSGTGVANHGALDNIAGNNSWTGPIQLLTNTNVGANAATSLTLSGGVTGAGLDFIKVDPGTVIFPGAGNNQGRTVINAGTVEVDGTIGTVRLAGGDVGGTGTIGDVTSGSGGSIRPGITYPADLIGTLHGSTVALNNTNVYFVNLSNPGSPTSDLLQLTTNISLGNATLSGLVATNVGLGDTFTIITAPSVTGHFAGAMTDPTESGAIDATIAYIDNEKFVVNYFADKVVISRQLANVSMALAPTIASPVYGQPERFVATLTPESPFLAVSGNVIFTVVDPDSNIFQFQIAINPATGTATFDPAVAIPNGLGGPLQLGQYTVTASYDGLNSMGVVSFNSANAGPTSVTVTEAGTTTAISSSQVPSMYGVTVTLTATVTTAVASPVSNSLAPTGTVTFFEGVNPIGSITLIPDAGGGVFSRAALSLSNLSVGSHFIHAVYNSDGVPEDNYLGSQSSNFNQTVIKSTTTTAVVSTPNPSNYGQQVTFTATVTGAGSGTPSGLVTFKLGNVTLGTGALNGLGQALFTTSPYQLPGGIGQIITAVYAGDSNFNGSSGTVTQDVAAGSSTTSVTTSMSPSAFGAPVTFTATVTPTIAGGAVATGTVTFVLDGTTTLGTGTLSAAGVATYTTTITQLPTGSHMITAQYGGDINYNPSTGAVSQEVSASNTTTQLTSSVSSAVATRGIVFTARVAVVSPGSGIPTGLVTFTDQRTGKVLGTVAVDATGVASVEMFLGSPVGNHTVRANYAGDGNYGASVGTVNVQIVANGVRTSQVILGTSMNPSVVGTAVTFTATVRDVTDFTINPFGTVAFYDGSQLLGFGTLSKVKQGITRATFTTSDLLVGVHSIQARYSGNTTFARRNSPLVSQEVKEIPTRTSTTVLSQLPSTPTGFGVGVTFTAVVTDTGAAPSISPTGTVTFTDTTTGTVLGTVSLTTLSGTQSQAVLTTNALGVGSHVIEATYDGDTDFVSEVSNSVTHDVTSVGSTLSLTSSANPSKFGQAVTFTARVSPVSGTGVATGTVVFKDGGVVVGTGTLNSSGVATLTTGALSVGTHTITAEYAGDGNVTGSMSSPLTQTVDKSGTQVLIGRSTADAKKPLTLSAKVEALAPGSGIPTGMVTFVIDGIVRGTGVLDASGVATLFIQGGLSQGQHTIVAQYAGDTNYNPRSGSKVFEFGGRGT